MIRSSSTNSGDAKEKKERKSRIKRVNAPEQNKPSLGKPERRGTGRLGKMLAAAEWTVSSGERCGGGEEQDVEGEVIVLHPCT